MLFLDRSLIIGSGPAAMDWAGLRTDVPASGAGSHLTTGPFHMSSWERFRAHGFPSRRPFRQDMKRPATKSVPLSVKRGRSSVTLPGAMRPLIVR